LINPASFDSNILRCPCTAIVILGVKEASFLLKLFALSSAPVSFFHAFNVQTIELVSKAHVSIKHHLERFFLHLNINSLPVVLVFIAIDVTV